jgi:PTS system ascorbate-specific IIA component
VNDKLPPLADEAIELQVRVADWRDAVRVVGAGLARSGAARPGYADEMIRMIEEHGPYIVIAPGLALAHARPGPEVLADGIAVATLERGVDFGHPHNDPVFVVIGLASTDPLAHVASIAAVANVFNDSSAIEELVLADSAEDVHRVFDR